MKQQTPDFEDLTQKMKGMGHPVRMALFHLLCNCPEGGLRVKSMYHGLGLDQPTTSRHLAVMRNSGLVSRRVIAGQTTYCLCLNNPFVSCLSACFITKNKTEEL